MGECFFSKRPRSESNEMSLLKVKQSVFINLLTWRFINFFNLLNNFTYTGSNVRNFNVVRVLCNLHSQPLCIYVFVEKYILIHTYIHIYIYIFSMQNFRDFRTCVLWPTLSYERTHVLTHKLLVCARKYFSSHVVFRFPFSAVTKLIKKKKKKKKNSAPSIYRLYANFEQSRHRRMLQQRKCYVVFGLLDVRSFRETS